MVGSMKAREWFTLAVCVVLLLLTTASCTKMSECEIARQEIARFEACVESPHCSLTVHEDGHLFHWYKHEAQHCGAPRPQAEPLDITYL